jgi:hypothetical protein
MILATLLVTEGTMQALAQPPHWAKNCMRGWQQYQKKPGHKAFAIKRSVSADNTHCGMAWGASSIAQAEKAALEACAKSACYVLDSK